MSDYSQVLIESLSSTIEGEEHLNRKCNVVKVLAVINDRFDKPVWVFYRKCVCGLYRDASKDIAFYEVKVPKDGFQIHTSDKCDIYLNPYWNGRGQVFVIQRRCHCRSENRSYVP